jgi:hypothetical protein
VLLVALDERAHLALLRVLLLLGDISISDFFSNLYGQITLCALAVCTFFFALAAMLYAASGVTGDQRARAHAQSALYIALGALALTLLAGTIAGTIVTAAGGQSAIPTPVPPSTPTH